MAPKKKYKKLTNAEKKANKEIREYLRAEGILPPRKKPLNRHKFAQEIAKELAEYRPSTWDIAFVVGFMSPSGDTKLKITDEQLGVLKVNKMAIEYRKYVDRRIEENPDAKITIGEIYDNVIKPIIDL